MKEIYLEITYRHGPPFAAYLLLPREGNEKSARAQPAAPGLLIDFTSDHRPIGLEITAPGKVSTATINRVLADLGFSPLPDADLARTASSSWRPWAVLTDGATWTSPVTKGRTHVTTRGALSRGLVPM